PAPPPASRPGAAGPAGSSDCIAGTRPGQDEAAEAVGVTGGDAGDGGVGAGGGGVDDQAGQTDRPLDRALGDVDVLDPEVGDGRVDAPGDPVAELQGVLGHLGGPGAGGGPWGG